MPDRVEIGAKFDYRVRFNAGPESVHATFNGKSQNKSAAAFIAPDRPGFYLLTLTAEKNGLDSTKPYVTNDFFEYAMPLTGGIEPKTQIFV